MQRFAVSGDQPKNPEQAHIDALASNAIAPSEDGIPPEVDYGWCGGRHILDSRFDFERNVFNDAISFAMRVDTNKMPSELKQAYKIMEEESLAAGNPSGFISKQQKKSVKETIAQRTDDELRSGKFRRSKLTPVLWDLPSRAVYSPATTATAEKLSELFARSFGLEIEPFTAGAIALHNLELHGKRRDYEDFRPTRFVLGPDGDTTFPEYPWVAKGPQPKDFLGNEFLLWLWHEAEHRNGMIKIEGGEAAIFIDKSLDLDCAYGITGKDALKGDGPCRMPEARDALRTGKLPRKAGIVLDASRQQYIFTFNAESFSISGAKLPEVEEADTSRTLFEERISLIRDLWKAMDALFESFLKVRASTQWESHTGLIRKWILQSNKVVAAVA